MKKEISENTIITCIGVLNVRVGQLTKQILNQKEADQETFQIITNRLTANQEALEELKKAIEI